MIGYLPTEWDSKEYLMESKMQTGLLLVLGTIVSLIGWIFFYPVDGGADQTAAEQAAQLMADSTLGKVGLLMGYGGMMAVFIGLMNIARSMATGGGRGSSYQNISKLLAIILLCVSAVAIGLEFTVAEATSAAAAATLMEVVGALEIPFALSCGLLLILLGVSFALRKNFHIIVAVLAVIAGALMLSSTICAADILGFAGWIGLMLVSLVLGGLTIRSKS